MGRHPTITDAAIVAAAREVLLEHGISATTAQVAARAGISEALVFHRFKTKAELFRAAMELPEAAPWLTRLPGRVGQGSARRNLEEIALEGLAFFRIIVPLAMMSWSSSPEEAGLPHPRRPAGPTPGGDEQPAAIRGMKTLAGYFEAEMRLGRMARHDAEVVARVFSGALWNQVSMELMFEGAKRLPMPDAMFVRSLVQLLFDGLTPDPDEE